MLGRLMQGYGRGSQLESSTEETHTRILLWPESQSESRSGSLSPPATPFGSPSTRVSPFDDRGGLELNESSHLRLIIAQDAFSMNEHPLLLFDTHPAESGGFPTTQRSPTSPVQSSSGGPISSFGHARNRSSTFAGASASWGRSTKESEPSDRVSAILDCMFGVSSATKSGSSTKLHFLPGGRSPASDLSSRAPSNPAGAAQLKTPLQRSRTAVSNVNGQPLRAASNQPAPEPRDAILVTLVFPVAVHEAPEELQTDRPGSPAQATSSSQLPQTSHVNSETNVPSKKPKPKENRTPPYAIGLVFYLPRPGEIRPSTSSGRPSSRASSTASSTPRSYGSESSSWTFLNAIPEHLWTDDSASYMNDRGISVIVRNWDVIMRNLSTIECLARVKIAELLQEVLSALIASAEKMPKGPQEQRVNQRKVFLRIPDRLSSIPELQREAKHTLWRVSYALRIPRVLTGIGLENGGHWLDEARYLVRHCGNKQQNFFLFNLLTAFLGSHTQWLERLGPEWYRKQFKALNKGKAPASSLASRTVIVCDSRSMARRVIFLLASFLPRNTATRLTGEHLSPLSTPDLASSSPGKRQQVPNPFHRHGYNQSRDGTLTFNRRAVPEMSTSSSSSDSVGGIARAMQQSSRSKLPHDERDVYSTGQPPVFSPLDETGNAQKTEATSSTATPGVATPIPYFASTSNSYFPDSAITDGEESGASADLARILRRDSSSQTRSRPPSINWGSLVNNVSGLWGRRQESISSTGETSVMPTASGLGDRRKHAPQAVPIQARHTSRLETMVNEASQMPNGSAARMEGLEAANHAHSYWPRKIQPPKLTVDENDGVVDVDIDLPGFVPWHEKGTPPHHHHSQSFASTDDGVSSWGSNSFAGSTSSSSSPNVAGYLKRYHEDFILQGVKSYAGLEEHVKQSMSRECAQTAANRPITPSQASKESEWDNVSTTLVADFRTYTIHRLTLRRRTPGSGGLQTIESRKPGTAPSKYGVAHKPGGRSPTPVQLEEFSEEVVMDFDVTLTDAIERVLHEDSSRLKSGATSKTHSRTVSTGTASSVRSMPLEISSSVRSRQWPPPPTASAQSDCRQAVVGALKQVVRSVDNDLAKLPRDRDAEGHVTIDGSALDKAPKHDNVLREGVKQWLLNVETRSVW